MPRQASARVRFPSAASKTPDASLASEAIFIAATPTVIPTTKCVASPQDAPPSRSILSTCERVVVHFPVGTSPMSKLLLSTSDAARSVASRAPEKGRLACTSSGLSSCTS
jgi:hypothetical protein